MNLSKSEFFLFLTLSIFLLNDSIKVLLDFSEFSNLSFRTSSNSSHTSLSGAVFLFGGFLTYSTGWPTAILIGIVLTILICVKASKEESKEYKSGRFAAECSTCKYEDIVELRD
jgi:hypothetical protein